jgi:hypothetical protein
MSWFWGWPTVCGLGWLTTTFRNALSVPSSRSIVITVNDWILGFYSDECDQGGLDWLSVVAIKSSVKEGTWRKVAHLCKTERKVCEPLSVTLHTRSLTLLFIGHIAHPITTPQITLVTVQPDYPVVHYRNWPWRWDRHRAPKRRRQPT